MKKHIAAILVTAVSAHAECVLQSTTTAQQQVSIQERSGLTQDIVRMPNGKSRCQVAFRAKINNTWHTAMSHWDFDDTEPSDRACNIAVKRAESSLTNKVTNKPVTTDQVLTCRDQPSLDTLREIRIGTVGFIHQFRPHPDYPRKFLHNNTQCQWFLDAEPKSGDVKIWQGVVCNVQDNKWAVVDKF